MRRNADPCKATGRAATRRRRSGDGDHGTGRPPRGPRRRAATRRRRRPYIAAGPPRRPRRRAATTQRQ
eukprot:8071243-Pyramimonas_sp.AAC.1